MNFASDFSDTFLVSFDVPERVRQRALASGPDTRKWLDELPHRLQKIERDWQIRIGTSLSGGSAAFVARARTGERADAVIKIAMPGSDFGRQIDTLVRAGGHGYAHVLHHDISQSALLMEALGPPLKCLPVSPERSIALLCKTLTFAWKTAPHASQQFDNKAKCLGQFIADMWHRLNHPCSEHVISQALQYADRRAKAFDPARCVVVHGDPHAYNALRVASPREGASSGFVFVDPDGFLDMPEYDLGVVLRDWCPELLGTNDSLGLARRYTRLLSRASHIPEQAIWEWGFMERVSTGLYLSAYGSESLGQPFFATAQMLVI